MHEPNVIDGVYTLVGKLAEGGMAVVYRASVNQHAFDYTRLYAYTQVSGRTQAERQLQAHRLATSLAAEALDRSTVQAILRAHRIPLPGAIVAVKIAKDDSEPERFDAEWQNLLCLNHPHVIQVYGGGWYSGRQYYAMELLEGVVDKHTIAQSFPVEEKIRIALQAALGLGYLHQNGLVHRDVKPDNLLTCRGPDGYLCTRVTDLGISKTADGSPAMTRTGQFMGTPQYMAPEQMRSARDVDGRADVYSLGASLYSLLLGVAPFHDKTTLYEIIASKCRGEMPLPLRQLNANLPHALDLIVQRAMASDRERRFASMAELVASLSAYLGTPMPALQAAAPAGMLPTPTPAATVGGRSHPAMPEPNVDTYGSTVASTRYATEAGVPAITANTGSSLEMTALATPTTVHHRQRTLMVVLGAIAGLMVVVASAVAVATGIFSALSPDGSLHKRLIGGDDTEPSPSSGTRPTIPAVYLIATRSNQGWMLTFQLKDYQLKEILYRVGATGAFQSTGHAPTLNMQTGLPQPNLTTSLPLSQTKTQIFVRLVRPDDTVEGPYELLFDPLVESIKGAKHLLLLTKENWLAFRDYRSELLVYFTALLSYRDAMREIRYSVDNSSLNLRFPLQMEMVHRSIPRNTQSVYVQIVYQDQSMSEVREFRVPPELQQH